jgi:cytochrome c556
MRHTRYLAAVLIALGLAACGGGSPTASDADVSPRFNAGGVMHGSGNNTGGMGGVMNAETNTPPPPPGDSTSVIGGGWIGSGT